MPAGDQQNPGQAEADPLIGKVLADRYRILRRIGQGGMGVVYLSEHALIEKKIALKVLFPELTRRTDLVARFLQEAKSASRIGHENVIDIFDFGQLPEGLVYIAMEYLDGVDLSQIVRTQGPLTWTRARPILMQITKGLRAAHDNGIIHRDMKPENIFVIEREANPEFVKVLDFGIAKVIGLDGDGPRLTQAGAIFGTPEYMSPEQAQGHPPDHRVDIYAVGCIMYHLLTGSVPFHADSFMGILSKHMLEPVIPPRTRRPDLNIPEEVEAVAMRAMEKDREKRWPDMDAFYRALGSAGDDNFEASRPNFPRAQLKYPALAKAGPDEPVTRTAVMDPDAVAAVAAAVAAAGAAAATPGPPSPAPARGVSSRAIAGGVAAAVAVAALVAMLSLRSSGRQVAPAAVPPAGATAVVPAAAVSPAGPPTSPAAAPAPAAPPAAATVVPAAAPEAPSGAARPARALRSRAAASEKESARERTEKAAAPSNDEPSTPAELKNPFSSP